MFFCSFVFAEQSKKYLTNYKSIDEFFVETSAYKKGENQFHKNGIVIWTGRPGCGKTLAAIHLIIKEQRREDINWTFRNIRSFEELSYIEKDSNTLIFIDNVFFSQIIETELEQWWSELKNVYNNYLLLNKKEKNLHRVGVIITAKENAIERVCSLMGKSDVTPLLSETLRINANVLTEKEKEAILEGQIRFAKEKIGAIIPKIDEDFREKIKQSEGPIGFPLCAQLYCCSEKYQKSGVNFFTCPIEILQQQIDVEIVRDKSNRTKSLFFILFIHEWQTKLGFVEKLQLQNDFQCRKFLDKVSTKLLKSFEPFTFNGLVNEAQRLVGAFLKEESDHIYKFLHDSVYEAVGAWFCESYIAETAKYFPLEILQNQEYENTTENNEAQHILATRLLYEILNQRLSMVFASKCFQLESFCKCFLSELAHKGKKTLINFLTVTNESSPVKLPCLFWTSRYDLTFLTEQIYDIVKKECASPNSDYHLYVSLYGECCAREEGLLMLVNGMLRDKLEEIKKRVIGFRDANENSILHLVATSKRTDEFASEIIEKLLKEANENLKVDMRNKSKKTPLMLAVCHPNRRFKVIRTLMDKHPKLHLMDDGKCNVVHHCLRSCNDDATCANYLKLILKGTDAEICLNKEDSKGNTPLAIAAMEFRYSRIHSILTLLEKGSTQIIKTINDDGFSPLHLSIRSLKGNKSVFAELECCVRVILCLSCGGSPDKLSNKDEKAITECDNDALMKVLSNPNDEKNMIAALDSIMEKIEECKDITDAKLPYPKQIGTDLQNRIQKSVQILKNCHLTEEVDITCKKIYTN